MAAAVVVSVVVVTQLGRDFLPPFNEGTVQVNVFLPPGTSLATSNRIAGMVDERLKHVEGVVAFAAGEPGKEILYPVATVIVGGIISSTLLDFLVHPALFWLFGRKDAEHQMVAGEQDDLGDRRPVATAAGPTADENGHALKEAAEQQAVLRP